MDKMEVTKSLKDVQWYFYSTKCCGRVRASATQISGLRYCPDCACDTVAFPSDEGSWHEQRGKFQIPLWSRWW